MSRKLDFNELAKEAERNSAYIIASINKINYYVDCQDDEDEKGRSMLHDLGREIGRDAVRNNNKNGIMFFSGAFQGMVDVAGYECAEKAFKKFCSDYESMVKGDVK